MTLDKSAGSLAMILAALMLISPAPAHAGGFGMEGPDDPPDPGGGCTGNNCNSGEDWNPTVSCPWIPGWTITQLLYCLQNVILEPAPMCGPGGPGTNGSGGGPGGTVLVPNDPAPTCFDPELRRDWIVSILEPPEYGIEIIGVDGGELNRITFHEDAPGFTITEVHILDRPYRMARIREIEGMPRVIEGPEDVETVSLTIDGVTASASTNKYTTAAAINNALVSKLQSQNFIVMRQTPYIYVVRNSAEFGVHSVKLHSTGTFPRSELSLFPSDDPIIPAAFRITP